MKENDDPRKLIRRPDWIQRLETRLVDMPVLNPTACVIVKLVVLVPGIIALLISGGRVHTHWAIALFCGVAIIDHILTIRLDTTSDTSDVRASLDRLSDYPLPIAICLLSMGTLSNGLLWSKIGIDICLLGAFFFDWRGDRNRMRNGLHYALMILLMLGMQSPSPRIASPAFVDVFLQLNILFSCIFLLAGAGVLQKRFLADTLSMGNLLCGVAGIWAASKGRPEFSLLFILAGAALDGFDGWAARKFGGTKFGVYSDDIADAVSYGLAPGAALWFVIGGVEGIVLGTFFATFTITRLIFFTLNKADSDPEYFCGVPSTAGGIIVLASIYLFPEMPAIAGLLVGVACILMVSFDTHYLHLGRAVSTHRRVVYFAPLYLFIMLAGGVLWGLAVPIALILIVNLLYGFLPTALHFRRLLHR